MTSSRSDRGPSARPAPPLASRLAWSFLAALAILLAVGALARWLWAVAYGGPILYGEGAVAHAGQLVARGLDPYVTEPPGTFVAANYPPLAFAVAALGERFGPFAALRLASIAATLGLAALVAWRARASWLVAAALGCAFLALFPVQVWGPAHKPDALAVGLTALAVIAAGPSWGRATLAGSAGALAVFAKPTAALPLAAVGAYLLWRERAAAGRVAVAFGGSLLVLAAAALAAFDGAAMLRHVVARNALPYVATNAGLLLVLGLVTLGAFALLAAGRADGRMRSYLAGALAVVLLGGREGATVNYLLDLAAASCLAIAPRVRVDRAVPAVVLAGQLMLTVLVTTSGLLSATGAWGDPRRVALAADLPRTSAHLAEDSGVLIANGIEPEVDDLFLWARLVTLGVIPDEVTPRVRDGSIATVIAEVPLETLDSAPVFERQRWPAQLVREILLGYRLQIAAPGHYRYVPRRDLAQE